MQRWVGGTTLAAASSATGGRQAIKSHGGAEGRQKETSAGACGGRGGSSDGTGGRRSGRQRRRWTTTTRATTAVETACGGGGAPIGESTPAVGWCFYGRPHATNSSYRIGGEKRQPTARSTSPPSAMKCEAINGSHGFTLRHTSLKRRRLRFES